MQVLNLKAMLSEGGNLHCPSSAMVAESRFPLQSSITVEYGCSKSLLDVNSHTKNKTAIRIKPTILIFLRITIFFSQHY